ncbi:hypothetical protein CMMCA002_06710 [Clavibacter michiganensis subsp. michiganensis]|nr:hypothetical protein [Clavibacter michiganensis]OUE15832.1 hypothetical protein CMMCA002_06710 [Clavibacter michiganensis subsp. michiganensis]
MAFGALHVVLLFEGDILLSYGILGLGLAALYRASDRAFRVLVWAPAIVFLVVAGRTASRATTDPAPSSAATAPSSAT